MERRFYLKFSGSAFDIKAETPKEAYEQVRNHLDCYCSVTTLEIGVDCDEAGWPLDPKPVVK